jgi:hypothetical protein
MGAQGLIEELQSFLCFTPWRDQSAALFAAYDAGVIAPRVVTFASTALEMTQERRVSLARHLGGES